MLTTVPGSRCLALNLPLEHAPAFDAGARLESMRDRLMRTFSDSKGTEWTVFEVKRTDRETKWSYLPEGFGDGWLCFECPNSKRRLTPIPPRWRELDEQRLQTLLEQAQPVARTRLA